MSVRIRGRGRRFFVIGDSNGTIFDGIIASASELPNITLLMTLVYAKEVTMENFAGEKALHPELMRQLRAQRAVGAGDTLVPYHTVAEVAAFRRDHGPGMLPENAASASPILVSTGHLNVSRILTQLGPHADFMLPPVPHGPSAVEPLGSANSVPVQLVRDLIAAPMAAFERGLAMLRECGFEDTYVLGMRPPALDDEGYERTAGVRSRAHLRYKLSLLFNALLQASCERARVRYVDCWPLLSTDGIFDERCELDFLHINDVGAERILNVVIADYAERLSARLSETEYARVE